jgi:hypothetical protein
VIDPNTTYGQNVPSSIPLQAQHDTTHICHEIGCVRTFSRAADLRRHHNEVHGQKRFLCGCCNKDKPFGSKRENKLLNHKAEVHEHIKGSRLRTCPECRGENTLNVLYFCSDDALNRHRIIAHGIGSIENAPMAPNDKIPSATKGKQLHSQNLPQTGSE